jgi:hypothetical protein
MSQGVLKEGWACGCDGDTGVATSCELGNKLSNSGRGNTFTDQLYDYKFLQKYSVSRVSFKYVRQKI